MSKKSNPEKNMDHGEIRLVEKRIAYRPNWNGARIDISCTIFGEGLPNCSASEEILTSYDILNCITFSDRHDTSITITFSKDFLRRILKSHIHELTENKII